MQALLCDSQAVNRWNIYFLGDFAVTARRKMMQWLYFSCAVNCLDDLHMWLLNVRGNKVKRKRKLIYAVYGACQYAVWMERDQ